MSTMYGCHRACGNCNLCEERYGNLGWCEEDCWKCRVCKFRSVHKHPFPYPLHRPLYWRPHYYKYPRTCYNTCGYKTCDDFHTQLNKYQRCLGQGENIHHCRSTYGCNNPKGFMHPSIPPQNPLFTQCKPCWRGAALPFK